MTPFTRLLRPGRASPFPPFRTPPPVPPLALLLLAPLLALLA
jgi:hypothetical protein